MIRPKFLFSLISCHEQLNPINQHEKLLLLYRECTDLNTFIINDYIECEIKYTYLLTSIMEDDLSSINRSISCDEFIQLLNIVRFDITSYFNENIESLVRHKLNIISIYDIDIIDTYNDNYYNKIYHIFRINGDLYLAGTKVYRSASDITFKYDKYTFKLGHQYLLYSPPNIFNFRVVVNNRVCFSTHIKNQFDYGTLYECPPNQDLNILNKLNVQSPELFKKLIKTFKQI